MLTKTVTISQPASTGSVVYTTIGFQPKLLMFQSLVRDTGAASHTATGAHGGHFFGACDPLLIQYGSYYYDKDNIANSSSGAGYSDTAIYIGDDGGNINANATVTSMNSDGFTLNWTVTDGDARTIIVTAIGGTDFNANVGLFQAKTSTGSQDVTGVGFTPNTLMLWQHRWGNVAPPSATANTPRASRGIVDAAGNQFASNVTIDGNAAATSTSSRYHSDTKCFVNVTAAGAMDVAASFTSYISDGFRINWSSVDGTGHRIMYIAMSTANSHVARFSEATTNTSQATTGTGFTPKLLMFQSITQTAANLDTTGLSHGSWEVGVATTSSEEYSVNVMSRDAQATMDVYGVQLTTIIQLWSTVSEASLGNADLTSLDSDGFTVTWSSTDGTARVIGYLALGGVTETARTPRHGFYHHQ